MKNSINTEDLYEILKVTPCEQNIMLAGKHGIGKSQILTSYFEKQGLPVITLFLGQMSDPGDLLGLPHFNEAKNCTEFVPPFWFPQNNQPVVLFLDELNRARPEILQTIMDLALNKKLAGRKLPEGSRLISAVNSGNEYELTELDPALVSRFNIYNFEPSVQNWISWAAENGIDNRIISYIQKKPDYLESIFNEDVENLTKTPDRRAWEKVSSIIKPITEFKPLHIKILSGLIGYEAASDFITSSMKSQEKRLTGLDLLSSGKNVFQAIQSIKNQEISLLINEIFGILECTQGISEDVLTKYSENLQAFINYLIENKRYEAVAYFTSLFAAKGGTNASKFLLEKCTSTVSALRDFVECYENE